MHVLSREHSVCCYRYTAREYDQDTGLYYYRARYYDSAVGRFISEDPITFVSKQTNFYNYVGNRATSHFDPYGLARCMYVINGASDGNGWFDCSPDDPRQPRLSFKAASGNNGDKAHKCKNNAACSDQAGVGPVPPGWYRWVINKSQTVGSHKHKGTLLEPIPGSLTDMHGRNGILTHLCMNPFGPSLSKPFCSEGCITAEASDIDDLNDLLTQEPNSVLYVTQIDKN